MKKKRILTFLIILSLFFVIGIAGCETQKEETQGAYIGGTDGLDISFIQDEPPKITLDNHQENFDITILLNNKGEFTIPNDKVIVSLSGISGDEFSLGSLDKKLGMSLSGITKERDRTLIGGQEEVRFEDASYKYDLNADFTTTIRADVCYLYQTDAIARLCLKKDASKRDKFDQCEITNTNVNLDVSGAPVKISSISQMSSGENKVKFIFDVENKGSGTVYSPDAFTSHCGGDNDEKKVEVEVKSPTGRIPVKCSSLGNSDKGTIKLVDNKKTLTCYVETNNLQESAFESPLSIKIRYFYRNAISTEVTVEDSEQ